MAGERKPGDRADRRAAAREQAAEIMRGGFAFRWDYTLGLLATAIGILGVIFPPDNKVVLVVWLLVLFATAIYPAFHCADWMAQSKKILARRTGLVLLAVFVCGLGVAKWPRIITINPAHVVFRGFENETFNFSIRNDRADDIYDVQVPFLIGYNKHLEDKFSVKVMPGGDPPQRMYVRYYYCFGTRGDGNPRNIPREEREVLIVQIPHLAGHGSRSFTVTYAGGETLETGPGSPDFAEEPTSYSPAQQTVGVRGEYRVCKHAMGTNELISP